MRRRAPRPAAARDQGARAIERLPDGYREALVLRDLEEMETSEVAAILGLEPAAVRQRYKVTNTASRRGVRYGNYVVGDATGKGQAWMHVGRWLLFKEVVDYEMTKLPDVVEEHIRVRAKAEGIA